MINKNLADSITRTNTAILTARVHPALKYIFAFLKLCVLGNLIFIYVYQAIRQSQIKLARAQLLSSSAKFHSNRKFQKKKAVGARGNFT